MAKKVVIGLTQRPVERDVVEFVQVARAKKVDRDAGIIYGVKILGLESRNGGTYSRDCLESGASLYEGARCNVNHPSRETPNQTRSAEDRFGVFQNVILEDDGLHADLHFLKSHPMADRLCEAAERQELNTALGFSHNARTIQRPVGKGKVIHESISTVRSVDLVADSATTNSIFESVDDETETDTQEGVEVISHTYSPLGAAVLGLVNEYLPKIEFEEDPVVRKKRVAELKKKLGTLITTIVDDDMASVEDPSFSNEENGMSESKEAAAGDLLESTDDGAVKEPQKGEEKEVAEQNNDEPPKKEDGDGDPKPVVESEDKSKDEKPAYEQAMDVLESVGVPVTTVRVKALMAIDESLREDLAKTWVETPGVEAKPKPRSSSVMESSRQEEQKPAVAALDEEQLKRDARLLRSRR